MTHPDLFTNVHKGIRRALFDTCVRLGRAGDDAVAGAAARAQLREILHFVAHHGDNEDAILVPLLARHAPAIGARMSAAHAVLEPRLASLVAAAAAPDVASHALYLQACSFAADYLDHMRFEEAELDPAIRAAVPVAELATFGKQSVARTPPEEQPMMLAWMLPAMTAADADAFLASMPPAFAAALRAKHL